MGNTLLTVLTGNKNVEVESCGLRVRLARQWISANKHRPVVRFGTRANFRGNTNSYYGNIKKSTYPYGRLAIVNMVFWLSNFRLLTPDSQIYDPRLPLILPFA